MLTSPVLNIKVEHQRPEKPPAQYRLRQQYLRSFSDCFTIINASTADNSCMTISIKLKVNSITETIIFDLPIIMDKLYSLYNIDIQY